MFEFSKRSLDKLDQVWQPLAALSHRVLDISDIDFAITDGLRTADEQNALYEIGRTKELDRGIVTKLDGYKRRSYHQSGFAVDFAVYSRGKINWDNKDEYRYIGRLFKKEFAAMQKKCLMPLNMKLNSGGLDWGWDFPHIEIKQ